MSRIITIDRSIPFSPAVIGRSDFRVVEERSRQWHRKKLDLDKVMLRDFEFQTAVDWKTCAARHLDAKIAQTIFEAAKECPEIIPDSWKEPIEGQPRCLFFLGTKMTRFDIWHPEKLSEWRYVVILYWKDDQLHMSYSYIPNPSWPKRRFAATI